MWGLPPSDSVLQMLSFVAVAAQAMTAAAKPLAELDQERKTLQQSQQARWLHFVKGE